jgi:hypothetical protein
MTAALEKMIADLCGRLPTLLPIPEQGRILVSFGVCPKCGNGVTSVGFSNVTIKTGGIDRKGNAYLCMSCSAILSVEIDPLAVKNEIVQAVVAAIKKG